MNALADYDTDDGRVVRGWGAAAAYLDAGGAWVYERRSGRRWCADGRYPTGRLRVVLGET